MAMAMRRVSPSTLDVLTAPVARERSCSVCVPAAASTMPATATDLSAVDVSDVYAPVTGVAPSRIAPTSNVQAPPQFAWTPPVIATRILPACLSVTVTGWPTSLPVAGPLDTDSRETPADSVAGAPGSPFAPAAPVAPVVPVAPFSPFAPFSAFTVDVESLDVVTAWFLICAVPTLLRGNLTAA